MLENDVTRITLYEHIEDYRKQEKITATALYYLGNNDTDMRFDVIEVMYKMCGDVPVVTKINHIKSAF